MSDTTPLYAIAGSILRIVEKNAEIMEDGSLVMVGDSAAELDAEFHNFNAKVEACAAAMKDYEQRANNLVEEANRLLDRAKQASKRRDWIKEYVRLNMISTGIDKVTGDLFTVSLKKTPDKVNVIDQNQIPLRYMKANIAIDGLGFADVCQMFGGDCPGEATLTPIKADILKAVKAGEVVEGVEITSDKTLVVK